MNARKHNLCLLTESFAHGGTERQFADLVTRLDSNKYNVIVGCLNRHGEFYEQVRAAGLPVAEFPLRRWLTSRTAKSAWNWFRLIRRVPMDLVHTFDLYTNVFAAPLARLAGVPIVVTSLRHSTSVCTRMQQWTLQRSFHWSDCVIANSHAIGDSLISGEGLPAARVRVLHSGVDLERFQSNGCRASARQRLGLLQDPLFVGVVGNLRREKDHRTLLAAATRVIERVPSVIFLLVGSGPLEAELRSLVEKNGLQSSVRFLGDRSDVPELLVACDLVVLPTLTESLPNVVLETMSAGRAIVVSAVGGCGELVENDRTGVLVPTRDPGAMAGQIIRLLTQPALREEMGRAARRRVEAEFDIKVSVKRLEAIYDELLTRKLRVS